jgi:hypothetical protein
MSCGVEKALRRHTHQRNRMHPGTHAVVGGCGSLSVDAQARDKAEAEELRWLDLHELEELADKSQKMIDDALARSRARRNGMLVAITSSTDSDVGVDRLASADQPAESSDH